MEVVTKKISARVASVAVVDPEEGAFGPSLTRFGWLRLWSHDVENNGNSVFIIVPNNALVGVGSICSHDSVALRGELGTLVVGHQTGDDVSLGYLFYLIADILIVNWSAFSL